MHNDKDNRILHEAALPINHGVIRYMAAGITGIMGAMILGVIYGIGKALAGFIPGATKGMKIDIKAIFLTGGLATLIGALIGSCMGLIQGIIIGAAKGWQKGIAVVLRKSAEQDDIWLEQEQIDIQSNKQKSVKNPKKTQW